MIITLNGTEQDVAEGATVADVVNRQHPDAESRRGVAVAVDRRVVPKTSWPKTTLTPGAQVEFVTAVQGG